MAGSIWGDLKEKLGNFGADVWDQTKVMTEIAKIKAEILRGEKEVEKLYAALGKAYYEQRRVKELSVSESGGRPEEEDARGREASEPERDWASSVDPDQKRMESMEKQIAAALAKRAAQEAAIRDLEDSRDKI